MSSEVSVELVESNALEVMQRAEIDVQISTAKRFPRSMEAFKKRGIMLATIDEETAESCLYRRPVGRENGRDVFAEGMSVRMAEIVASSYGNMRVYSMLLEQTDRQVKARGVAIDLETNFASSSEIIESTVTKSGQPFSERMRIVIAKAALAKARRDATFQVIPKSVAKPLERAVKQLLMGDAKSLDARRKAAVGWISKLGIITARVYAALGVKGEADLGADELETLTGIKTAIKDGEITIDEAFPEPQLAATTDDQEEADAGLAPAKPKARAPRQAPVESESTPTESLQTQLAEMVIGWGHDFTTFQRWGVDSGNIEGADDLTSFDEVPGDVARRFLRAKNGLKLGLDAAKGGVA
jgi:hypothetical protein